MGNLDVHLHNPQQNSHCAQLRKLCFSELCISEWIFYDTPDRPQLCFSWNYDVATSLNRIFFTCEFSLDCKVNKLC